MHYVYILYSSSLDRYYIGQTQDLASRLAKHNDSENNNHWTKRGIPWELKLQLLCEDRSESMRLERYLKSKKRRSFTEQLIEDEELQQWVLGKIKSQ